MQVVDVDESEFKQKRRGQGWRNQTYDNREFVAWDGEGWTDHRIECPSRSSPEDCDGSCTHHYCLFGSSKGGGIAGSSLSTRQCLDHILDIGNQYPKAIHIGFAFSYDVNMILRDLSPKALKILKDTTFVHWRGYRIEHIPKKWLIVAKGKTSVQIQDIFSFFACSFVKALTQWGVGTPDEIAQISVGKDSRSDFSLSDLEHHIRPYWEKELALLVELGNNLRSILYSAGLRITGWYGPGNIASFLYKKHGTKETMDRELPKEVIEAAAYAYAGGRFEGFKAGQHLGPVYSADINSAYPAAMAELPDLRTGRWTYHKSWSAALGVPTRMGLYHVFFCFDSRISSAARLHGFPLPLFHRRHSGQVWYPDMSEGWYHAPEIRILLKIHEESGGKAFSHFEIKEAWIYEDDGSYPFQWVQEMYDQRAVWKREGKPAQLALKLGINSLYGKLAQRIGSKDGEVPTWHQLEWAGLITSHTRAMLYEAMRDDWKHVVSVETDGIYSTVPLTGIQGNCGSGLGQWETAEYTGIVFLQNGVYWLRNQHGDWLPPKSRGIPQRQLSRTAAISALQQKSALVAHQQMFIGYGIALHRSDMDIWRHWVHAEKQFEFGGNGKRFHDETTCPQCSMGLGWEESLHTLSLRLPHPGVDRIMSSKHHLPWWDEMYDGVENLKHELRWQITEH